MVMQQYFAIPDVSLCELCSVVPLMISTGEGEGMFYNKKHVIVDNCKISDY